jgi:hypothetical protein
MSDGSVVGGAREIGHGDFGQGLSDMASGALHAVEHYGQATGDAFATAYHYGAAGVDGLLGDSAGQAEQNALGDQSNAAVDSRFHEAVHDVMGDPVPEPAPEPIVVPFTPSDDSSDSSADDGGSSSYDDSSDSSDDSSD